NNLPDSEAEVIRALVDRIEALEEQIQTLQRTNFSAKTPVLAGCVAYNPDFSQNAPVCSLKYKAIQEFLDGAGI
ncbi:MAG: serine O-acetyltransferase, partial [Nostoc sp.]